MMKRIICLLLALLLTAGLFGCHSNNNTQSSVEFYYPRKTDLFVYGASDGALAAEMREVSGHAGNLEVLIPLYLRGPKDENLRSPFPTGCKLVEVLADEDTLFVTLSEEFAALENLELTLACASLAKTCISLSGKAEVRIEAKSETRNIRITLSESNLMLFDDTAFETVPAEEAP